MSPPSLQFTSDVFHPNIYRDGKVCVSTLQVSPDDPNAAGYWRPVLGVEQALLSVVSLLSDPNLDDPANPDAASMLRDEPSAFKNKVKKSALLSQTLVPDDFIMPVVVSSSAAAVGYASGRGGSRLMDSAAGAGYGDDDDDEEEEQGYVYSDDEWDQDINQDSDAYSVDESETGTMASSSSSLMNGAGALVRGTSAVSTKSKSDKKKKEKKKKTDKADKTDKKEKNKVSASSSSSTSGRHRHGSSRSKSKSKDTAMDDAVVQGTVVARRSSRIKSGSRSK